jgi:hypothetical protein
MKIISGGQTGADLGGLEGARDVKVETGGHCPAECRTENGPNLELKSIYGLVETEASNYNARTLLNIKNSDGTAIFADKLDSRGTVLTINNCRTQRKPYICNPTAGELIGFITWHNVEVLNVAGNRESVAPGIQLRVRDIIYKTLTSEKIVDDRWVE